MSPPFSDELEADALKVLNGTERVAKPGCYRIWRDGDTLCVEVFNAFEEGRE